MPMWFIPHMTISSTWEILYYSTTCLVLSFVLCNNAPIVSTVLEVFILKARIDYLHRNADTKIYILWKIAKHLWWASSMNIKMWNYNTDRVHVDWTNIIWCVMVSRNNSISLMIRKTRIIITKKKKTLFISFTSIHNRRMWPKIQREYQERTNSLTLGWWLMFFTHTSQQHSYSFLKSETSIF